jgi:ketosteroid isomerase-like protein
MNRMPEQSGYKPDFYEVLDGFADPRPDPENLRRSTAALRGWMTTAHQKDLDGIRTLMADDIVIELPFSESGVTDDGHFRVYRGIAECVAFWAAAFEAEGETDGMRGCELTFSADGRVAFLESRAVLTMANGRTYRNRYVVRYVFDKGKVAHVREYYNPIQSAYGFRRKIADQFYLDTLESGA